MFIRLHTKKPNFEFIRAAAVNAFGIGTKVRKARNRFDNIIIVELDKEAFDKSFESFGKRMIQEIEEFRLVVTGDGFSYSMRF